MRRLHNGLKQRKDSNEGRKVFGNGNIWCETRIIICKNVREMNNSRRKRETHRKMSKVRRGGRR